MPSRLAILCPLVLAGALLFAAPAFAGPPLLCHPFDIAGARSLPWGEGWNRVDPGYDRARLVADTEALLAPRTPVIVRMETLRRAAIYASANGPVLRALARRLDARIAAARDPQGKALALFDVGYFAETLQDVERLQAIHASGDDMPGIGEVDAAALRGLASKGDGSVRIAQALRLRPGDAALRFAAALVASADEREVDRLAHARLARAGAADDRLLARNLPQLAD